MTATLVGYVPRAGWGATPAGSRQAFVAPVVGGTTHWEGPDMWGAIWALAHGTCAEKVRGVQRYHMSHGYVDIAYNFVVCPHGYVYEGRGLNVRSGANGTAFSNGHSYATCQLRGVGDPFPTAMQDATEWCYTLIRLYGGAGAERKCHRDWVSTQCPGDDGCHHTKTFATTVPAPGRARVPAPLPVPSGPPFPGRVLQLTSPLMRGLDVAGWQARMKKRGWGITVDGVYGAGSVTACRAFQTEKRLPVDGKVGRATWVATFTAPVTG